MALARKLTAKIYDIKAHNGNVTALDLGETGRVLVTGGQDRNVNLWAFGQEECFMSLTGHNRPIDCVRFAYNDDYVYSADDMGIIRRWDLNEQTVCSTLNGHMKSVRTLDFNPSGEYVVSGSNDTTVRLWDLRDQNKCMKIYRGHMSHVNSVKFSPDGLWIASAGTEGSVIVWDIRKSKQIMDLTDQPPGAAITCIQFHPFEFLLAVGRMDGTVTIYDLEHRVRISQTDATSQFYGKPVKCITFSDNGECLFVGTAAGISIIGWEPDREFDHILSTWTTLGDMKVVNRRLLCGSFEDEYVSICALSIDRVFPFYNPSNAPAPAFIHNGSVRKSFSRGNQKLRLSIGGSKPPRLVEDNEECKSPSLDGHSSPNLSLEMVDETPSMMTSTNSSNSPMMSPPILPPSMPPLSTHPLNGHGNNGNVDSSYHKNGTSHLSSFNFSSMASSTGYSSLSGNGLGFEDGPSSLKMPGERDLYQFDRLSSCYNSELEYGLNDSHVPIIANFEQNEAMENFTVNQNNHQNNGPNSLGGYHYSSTTHASNATNTASSNNHSVAKTNNKPKAPSVTHRRLTQASTKTNSTNSTSASYQQRHRLTHLSSVSTTDLHKIDDNMSLQKSSSTHVVPKGGKRTIDSSHHSSSLNKENARNKNIPVQILVKPPPPTRSRTSLDLRSPPQHNQRQSNIPISYRPDPSLLSSNRNLSNRNNMIDDTSEIQMLSVSHEQVYQELSNRHATLQLIRNSTRSQDIVGALKQAIKINGRTVFVDLLGAILEKTSSWNLDMCLLLLPEIYELLQSQHKFHYTRACDTLRVILSNFLPIIQENLDPWAASGLGVDVTREDRQRKCIECQSWLLQIRNMPDSNHFGTSLTQLQNMIVNI